MKLKQKINNIFNSEIYKNIFTLIFGIGSAHLISLILLPILLRIFGPSIYGEFQTFWSSVLFLSTFACLRYDFSIVLSKTDEESNHIFLLSTVIAIFFSVIVTILVFLFIFYGVLPVDKYFILFFPFALFGTAFYQLIVYRLNRIKKYKHISYLKVTSSLLNLVIALILSIFARDAVVLIIAYLIALYLILIFSFIKFRLYKLFVNVRINDLQKVAIKYFDFPKTNFFQSILESISNHGFIPIITIFWGTEIAGFYGVAQKILHTLKGLIGTATGQVIYQKAAEQYNKKENLNPIVKKAFINLFCIGFPAYLLLMVFAPFIVDKLLGSDWQQTIKLVQIMCPWVLCYFVVSPLTQIPLIYNKFRMNLIISASFNITACLTLVCMGNLGLQFQTYILVLTVMGIFHRVFLGGWIYSLTLNKL